jgi:hypothetical protein
MVSALFDALHEGKTFSQFDLAGRLHTTPEAVMAGLDFLKKSGYVRQVCVQGNCSKKCAGCAGGCAVPWNAFSFWVAVK